MAAPIAIWQTSPVAVNKKMDGCPSKLATGSTVPSLRVQSLAERPTMYLEDYEEWRWGQILTRRADYNPDDQPPVEELEDDDDQ